MSVTFILMCRSTDPATDWHPLGSYPTVTEAEKQATERRAYAAKFGTRLEYRVDGRATGGMLKGARGYTVDGPELVVPHA